MLSLKGVKNLSKTSVNNYVKYVNGESEKHDNVFSVKSIVAGSIETDKNITELLDECRGGISSQNKSNTKNRLVCTDLNFSVPKSLSIRYFQAIHSKDIKLAESIEKEILESTRNIINHIENNINICNIGKSINAADKGKIKSFHFLHHTSRNGDPHLHVHVAVPNMAIRQSDNKKVALNNKNIYRKSAILGTLFRADLQKKIEKIGIKTELDTTNKNIDYSDSFRIKSVDKKADILFSSRQRDMRNLANKMGLSYDDLNEKEKTYLRKKTRKSKEDIELGSREEYASWVDKVIIASKDIDFLFDQEKQTNLVVEEKVLEYACKNETFVAENQVEKTLSATLFDPNKKIEDFKQIYRDFFKKESDNMVLTQEKGIDKIGHKKAVIEENFLFKKFEEAKNKRLLKTISKRKINQSIHRFEKIMGFELNKSQRNCIENITKNKQQLGFIQGDAGAGKTTVMQVMKDIYQEAGYDVIGLSPTAVASQELKKTADINKSKTLTSFICTKDNKLKDSTVFIIDEASMIDNKTAVDFFKKIEDIPNKKVLFVGDKKQLQAVGRGKFFELSKKYIEHVEINQVMRQKNEYTKNVVDDFKNGNIVSALDGMQTSNKLRIGTHKQMIDRVVQDFKNIGNNGKTYIVANTNSDVEDINNLIRNSLKKTGIINDNMAISISSEKTGEILEFCIGDRVMFNRNKYSKKIVNSETGTVSGMNLKNKTLIIDKDKGGSVEISLNKYKNISHAYAITAYKAQGKTIDNVICFVNGDNMDNLNSSYVKASRAKKDIIMNISNPEKKEDLTTKEKKRIMAAEKILGQNSFQTHTKTLAIAIAAMQSSQSKSSVKTQIFNREQQTVEVNSKEIV